MHERQGWFQPLFEIFKDNAKVHMRVKTCLDTVLEQAAERNRVKHAERHRWIASLLFLAKNEVLNVLIAALTLIFCIYFLTQHTEVDENFWIEEMRYLKAVIKGNVDIVAIWGDILSLLAIRHLNSDSILHRDARNHYLEMFVRIRNAGDDVKGFFDRPSRHVEGDTDINNLSEGDISFELFEFDCAFQQCDEMSLYTLLLRQHDKYNTRHIDKLVAGLCTHYESTRGSAFEVLRAHPGFEKLRALAGGEQAQWPGVFSPGVVIFKHDLHHGCVNFPKQGQRIASVITVAAPCLPKLTPDGENFADASDLEDLRGKIWLVYRMAAHNGQQYLVLVPFASAMRCGAYRCHPVLVANEMKSILLNPEFKGWFRKVEFAVYTVPRNGPGNYDVFKEVFKDVKVQPRMFHVKDISCIPESTYPVQYHRVQLAAA
ncbi:hypothetical protein BDQ17DRAFT_1436537 [Cyathus striatus]|nr:hypothetical protein BDQ17DRAFT_1436537 [Cyathus striatus]